MSKFSRYAVLSDRTYLDAGGNSVRLVYGTRQSKVIPVQAWACEDLLHGDHTRVTPKTIAALEDLEILVSEDLDERGELREVTNRNAAAAADTKNLHLALLPTSYCNMGCTYCGQEHVPGRLEQSHRDRIRERVTALIRAPGVVSIRIDWFGAEPLLGLPVIQDLSTDFIREAAEAGVRYFAVIVTNGSLLNRRTLHRLAAAHITHLEITLDGPPAVHDRHRPLKTAGRGSFWTIIKAMKLVLEDPQLETMNIRVRSNVDATNYETMPEFFDLMAEHGFAHPRIRFYVAPVHSWGNDISDYEVATARFAASELEWMRQMISLGLRTDLLPGAANHVVCPAVTRAGEIISSAGSVFSCSEHPLVPAAERNEVLIPLKELMRHGPATLRPAGQFDDWNLRVGQGQQACSHCPLFATCGGACPKAWSEDHPPCPSYKFNLQGRLDLIAERNGFTIHAS